MPLRLRNRDGRAALISSNRWCGGPTFNYLQAPFQHTNPSILQPPRFWQIVHATKGPNRPKTFPNFSSIIPPPLTALGSLCMDTFPRNR